MTESDWLVSDQPKEMIGALFEGDRRRSSERKFRLFACACVRRLWGRLGDPRSREAVEIAERYADSAEENAGELQEALYAVHQVALGLADDLARSRLTCPSDEEAAAACSLGAAASAASAAAHAAEDAADYVYNAAVAAAERSVEAAGYVATEAFYAAGQGYASTDGELEALRQAEAAEQLAQADLLRCVVGNPFRAKHAIDPLWLTWNDCIVRRLAEGIYAERRFGDMGVLADALEEVGCMDQEVLAHLRSPGPHARGCHVVDLLLGRD